MKKEIYYYKKIKEAGERQGWWDSVGLVTALSGGGDSVAMLWLLRRFYSGRIVAAHLDHCTREGMSHEDAKFSVELCEKWGIKCVIKTVEVYKERLTGESFEMAGEGNATPIFTRRRRQKDCPSSLSATPLTTWWRLSS